MTPDLTADELKVLSVINFRGCSMEFLKLETGWRENDLCYELNLLVEKNLVVGKYLYGIIRLTGKGRDLLENLNGAPVPSLPRFNLGPF